MNTDQVCTNRLNQIGWGYMLASLLITSPVIAISPMHTHPQSCPEHGCFEASGYIDAIQWTDNHEMALLIKDKTFQERLKSQGGTCRSWDPSGYQWVGITANAHYPSSLNFLLHSLLGMGAAIPTISRPEVSFWLAPCQGIYRNSPFFPIMEIQMVYPSRVQ